MILVTGAKGQLGGDVCRLLEKQNLPFVGCDIDTLDITRPCDVESFFNEREITAVVHCAAYTAVDKAEDNRELCFAVNEIGTQNIAMCAEKANAKMIYISTDYVFDGKGSEAFETDSEKAPLNTYGESKLMGERAALRLCSRLFIVRTSWVFGEKNTNFIATMLRLSKTNDSLSVVCDQVGSPTYSSHLASLLCEMIKGEKYGVYHATNEGFCSWLELASYSLEKAGREVTVNPVKSCEYKTKATRPLNSRLSKKSLVQNGFSCLPSWQAAVDEYLNAIGEIKE